MEFGLKWLVRKLYLCEAVCEEDRSGAKDPWDGNTEYYCEKKRYRQHLEICFTEVIQNIC